MPRHVRNFWLDVRIDGRASKLEGGPRAKCGGLEVVLYAREEGEIVRALRISCVALTSGLLVAEVIPCLPLAKVADGWRVQTTR